MLRTTALAFLAATVLGTAGAAAQSIDLGGRGGPSIDLRNEGQRERDFRREERARDRASDRRAFERGRGRDDLSTGSNGRNCRTVTVRERDDRGRSVTRRTQECR